MAGDNSSGTGGVGMLSPEIWRMKMQRGAGANQNRAYTDAPVGALLQAYANRGTTSNGTDPAMARLGGFDIVALPNGYYAINRAGTPGMGASQHNDTAYDIVDGQGNYIASNTWRDLGTDGTDKIVDGATKALTAAFIGGGVLGGFGIGPMAQAGGVMNPGVAGAGVGSTGVAGAATAPGVSGAAFGDTGLMYAGADSAAAASLGGGAMLPGAATVGGGTMSNIGNIIKSGASKVFGGGTGGGFEWTDLIGPATQAASAYFSGEAAEDAANTQSNAAREAAALSEPWRKAGGNALNRLQELLGIGGNTGAADFGRDARDFSMADFVKDPGYAFRVSEGQAAIDRDKARGGKFFSGGRGKALVRFGQDMGSQEFGNAFNRFQVNRSSRLAPLQSMAGQGQTAAQTVGEYTTQGANARAAGDVSRANSWSNALTGAYDTWKQNELMNQLLRR